MTASTYVSVHTLDSACWCRPSVTGFGDGLMVGHNGTVGDWHQVDVGVDSAAAFAWQSDREVT